MKKEFATSFGYVILSKDKLRITLNNEELELKVDLNKPQLDFLKEAIDEMEKTTDNYEKVNCHRCFDKGEYYLQKGKVSEKILCLH